MRGLALLFGVGPIVLFGYGIARAQVPSPPPQPTPGAQPQPPVPGQPVPSPPGSAAQPQPPAQPVPAQPQPQPQPQPPFQPQPPLSQPQPQPQPWPPPPPGWSPYPQQPWQPPPQQPEQFGEGASDAEDADAKKRLRGGLPLSRRGGFWLDTGTTAIGDGRLSVVSITAVTSMPIAKTTFLEPRLPLAITRGEAYVGNPMVGLRHVFASRKSRLYWTLGAAFGFPVYSSSAQGERGPAGTVPRAFWDRHELTPDILPLELDVGLEVHFESALLRFEVEPVMMPPIGGNDDFHMSIQHAAEFQFGHAIGGGFRLQGVATPTDEADAYQLAMEPFLSIERELGFLRLGLMLPLDKVLGPPLASIDGDRRRNQDGLGSWGLLVRTGLRFD